MQRNAASLLSLFIEMAIWEVANDVVILHDMPFKSRNHERKQHMLQETPSFHSDGRSALRLCCLGMNAESSDAKRDQFQQPLLRRAARIVVYGSLSLGPQEEPESRKPRSAHVFSHCVFVVRVGFIGLVVASPTVNLNAKKTLCLASAPLDLRECTFLRRK